MRYDPGINIVKVVSILCRSHALRDGTFRSLELARPGSNPIDPARLHFYILVTLNFYLPEPTSVFYKSSTDLKFSVQPSSFSICPKFLMASTCPSETFRLGPFTTPRIWTGLWQLSSNAWGSASVSKVRSGMARHVEMGYTAFGEYNPPAISSSLLTSYLTDMVCSFVRNISSPLWSYHFQRNAFFRVSTKTVVPCFIKTKDSFGLRLADHYGSAEIIFVYFKFTNGISFD